MRFRGKSIRRKIVALLLVPLVSLTALWGFATTITGGQALRLLDVQHVMDRTSDPVAETIRSVQAERRQTLVYLSDPRPAGAFATLRERRDVTDRAVTRLKARAEESRVRDAMSDDMTSRMATLSDALSGLRPLRVSVDEHSVSSATQGLNLYNRVIVPAENFLETVQGEADVDLDNRGRALIGLDRAQEMVSREEALVNSALIAGRVTADEIRVITSLVAGREFLYDTYTPSMPPEAQAEIGNYWRGPDTEALRDVENRLIAAGPVLNPKTTTAERWEKITAPVLHHLAEGSTKGHGLFKKHIEPPTSSVLLRVRVAGVLGFVALLVSVIVSVRVGRDLIRDLSQLRKEAQEVSGVRLPSVIRRLAAGEQVDVETEAPRLEYERDEVGQVGQALNTLQRAAVEAAVKQAGLRRGVSEVFVNLARRNQVLLHRQLTLLDTMERRTEDTEELADLFRLDHLTTRMRRHAEGLVILSGAAASRQWRKPVQLMDVVRAAVAEVEDYERIEVRRLPRLGVGGPAVSDLTHLIAELLENATMFSPPHTAVHVHGERVANGFTLEIHDRGLGMAPEMLLDANLRLAETPEFELSDTDRLGLFVVSRLAQRQNVRVSLQPSPYGGTTAVIFLPAALLTDAPETQGAGFRLDRKKAPERGRGRVDGGGRGTLAQVSAEAETTVIDGPVELEPPVGLPGTEDAEMSGEDDDIVRPGDIDDKLSRRSGIFRARDRLRDASHDPSDSGSGSSDSRHSGSRSGGSGHAGPGPDGTGARLITRDGIREARDDRREWARGGPAEPARDSHDQHQQASDPARPAGPSQLPRRRPPTLVADRGRRVDEEGRAHPAQDADGTAPDADRATQGGGRSVRDTERSAPDAGRTAPRGPSSQDAALANEAASALGGLPRRVRQASLAPQLREGSDRSAGPAPTGRNDTERDADEVRNRMASLQRGWQRGRRQNDADDTTGSGETQGTTSEGDGR
ncbi:nitrate- and nitrite sensing domain-containing protein [Streptomyces sp. NPDC088725]|uniref:sensor histidine kinase n=1 Tax=Streptomyces sp. NPDC088725 TaxID=3365873 RepID=UPI0038113C53